MHFYALFRSVSLFHRFTHIILVTFFGWLHQVAVKKVEEIAKVIDIQADDPRPGTTPGPCPVSSLFWTSGTTMKNPHVVDHFGENSTIGTHPNQKRSWWFCFFFIESHNIHPQNTWLSCRSLGCWRNQFLVAFHVQGNWFTIHMDRLYIWLYMSGHYQTGRAPQL